MPPNLGGFFMVRSYYPSECHADYFDFERIEALKPAIEACGISRSEERFSRNAETDLVCRLLLEKKKIDIASQSTCDGELWILVTCRLWPALGAHHKQVHNRAAILEAT